MFYTMLPELWVTRLNAATRKLFELQYYTHVESVVAAVLYITGYRFAERTASHISVDVISTDPAGLGVCATQAATTSDALCSVPCSRTRRTWEVLNVLDFSSERQRMSIIVRSSQDRQLMSGGDEEEGEITLYCKGADARVLTLLADPGVCPKAAETLAASQKHIHEFACQGLRTLVVASRKLTHAEWSAFDQKYQEVGASVDSDKEERLEACMGSVERGLTLLAVTGIEDRLQDGVPDAICALRAAGIKVWVITGDKDVTAVNIGVSCGLVRNADAILRCTAAGPVETRTRLLEVRLALQSWQLKHSSSREYSGSSRGDRGSLNPKP